MKLTLQMRLSQSSGTVGPQRTPHKESGPDRIAGGRHDSGKRAVRIGVSSNKAKIGGWELRH